MENEKEEFDKLEMYCSRLGHAVPFKYCRQAEIELPCPRIVNCWKTQIPIEDYLREKYDENTMNRILHPQKPGKIISLIEEVQKHKKSYD